MTSFARVLTLTLALLVTVTSVHMAQARGHMAGVAGQVVICNGQGREVVALDHAGDRSGAPVELVHSCPDCLLVLASTDSPAISDDPQAIHMYTLAQAAVITPHFALIPNHPPARGPPHII